MYRYKPSGFTLIELMIVLLILALSFSVIVPLSVRQVDQAKERGERDFVVLLLEKARRDSYFNSISQQLTFKGKQVVSHWPAEKIYDLEFVSFADATVVIEASGHSSNQQLSAASGGKTWILAIEHETSNWSNAD